MASNFLPGFFGTVAAGDLYGNGGTELVAGSWDHTLYAWDRNGNTLGGYPINLWDTVWDTPTLADLEHLRRIDIIEGSDSNVRHPRRRPGHRLGRERRPPVGCCHR